MALALIIDSCCVNKLEPGMTDSDHKNLANRSMSPLSSSVSHTCATCWGEKLSDGIDGAACRPANKFGTTPKTFISCRLFSNSWLKSLPELDRGGVGRFR